MPRLVPALICVVCFAADHGSGPPALDRAAFLATLGFELPPSRSLPGGWGGLPRETITVDRQVVHSGESSVRIQRDASSDRTFSYVGRLHPVRFSGAVVELRGYLRTADVEGFAGLWLRLDSANTQLALDNMERRRVSGVTGWTAYSIKLPFHPETKRIAYGVVLAGTGTAWGDDLELLIDGKLVADSP